MLTSIATNLAESSLKAIKQLEEELHRPILAFKDHDIDAAQLSETQIAKLQSLEKELGLTLVATQ